MTNLIDLDLDKIREALKNLLIALEPSERKALLSNQSISVKKLTKSQQLDKKIEEHWQRKHPSL